MPALAHLGIGFASKNVLPHVPLWVLLVCSMLLDLLSFVFILISPALWIHHGLFMAFAWSILGRISFGIISNYKANEQIELKKAIFTINKNNIIIGMLIFSHWILDFIGWPMTVLDSKASGVPLLFDDTQNIGLGVYGTWFGALTMDVGVFIVGVIIYYKTVKNR